ncbi:MAG: DNA polymerase IV, partial [Erysipelotrichaceae bacterium]|nr:DNA polymerase IV [Erysipelotrichaceae bacterium]
MKRTILHCDLNCFFASVEMLYNPELRDVPMAIAGDKESRHGIILAKNVLAKKAGVKTAETIGDALKKCPNLVLRNADYETYEYFSEKIRDLYYEYTDRIEPFGIDECWLDITESIPYFGSAQKIVDALLYRSRTEIGLTLSIGVSFNKIYAKLGSDLAKED